MDEYIAAAPPGARLALERLRELIKAAAPGSSELIRYRMPVIRHEGRQLVGFAAFKGHCSFFVMSPDVLGAHSVALKGYDLAAGTIRFAADRGLPAGLVKTLVKARIAENRALPAQRIRKFRRTPQRRSSIGTK